MVLPTLFIVILNIASFFHVASMDSSFTTFSTERCYTPIAYDNNGVIFSYGACSGSEYLYLLPFNENLRTYVTKIKYIGLYSKIATAVTTDGVLIAVEQSDGLARLLKSIEPNFDFMPLYQFTNKIINLNVINKINVLALALAFDGTMLALCSIAEPSDGFLHLQVYDVETNEELLCHKFYIGNTILPILEPVFSADKKMLFFVIEDWIHAWNLNNKEIIAQDFLEDQVVDISCNQTETGIIGTKKHAYLWHIVEARFDKIFEVEDEQEKIYAVCMSIEGNIILVGVSGAQVRIINSLSRKCISTIPVDHKIEHLALNSHNILAVAGKEAALQLIDLSVLLSERAVSFFKKQKIVVQCKLCNEILDGTELEIKRLSCDHIFHKKCIDQIVIAKVSLGATRVNFCPFCI